MMKKILGIVVCTLVLATCLPATGTIKDDQASNTGIAPRWVREHTIHIKIPRIWIYDCGDNWNNEPGEYSFIIFAIPQFKHAKSWRYEVNDNDPGDPPIEYNFGYIGNITTKRTPVWLVIIAIELDEADNDINTNDIMDWYVVRFNPPRGEYPASAPYSYPLIQWKANPFFWADVQINFYYED